MGENILLIMNYLIHISKALMIYDAKLLEFYIMRENYLFFQCLNSITVFHPSSLVNRAVAWDLNYLLLSQPYDLYCNAILTKFHEFKFIKQHYSFIQIIGYEH